MDQTLNRAKARMLTALRSASQSSAAASWQEPLHLHEDLGVVKNMQEFSHINKRENNKNNKKYKICRIGSWNIGTLKVKQ